jgi:hypothetical protein
MLHNLETYAEFIYSLPQKYSAIKFFKTKIYTKGPNIGEAAGLIGFDNEIELKFTEQIDFKSAKIYDYSYQIKRNDYVLYYYDPQPHPENPDLASTFPHHKHLHPNIKHNRQPAPGISFDKPNLPFLIEEIISNLFN